MTELTVFVAPNIETIRNFLITNPQLISMSPEEFKNIVKFN
jgi:hypothetical protein